MTDSPSQPCLARPNELTGKDLKSLKKQVLKQSYDMQIKIKGQKSGQNLQQINPEREVRNKSEGSLYSSRSLQLIPSYSVTNRNLEKQLLKQSYDNQILRKNQIKIEEKLKLREENDVLSDLYKYQSDHDQRQRKQKEEYAQFLVSEINRKKELQTQLKREQSIKQASRANRQNGLLNKEHSFREYFSSLNRDRDNISSDYLSYINQSKRTEQGRIMSDKQMMDRQKKMIQQQYNQERRRNIERKQELRKVLEQQIMDNRSFKASELQHFKNRGYIQSERNLYNPISNPIDYQLDVNNKYLIKQLLQKQGPQ